MILDFLHISNPWVSNILLTLYWITIISVVVLIISENRNPLKSLPWILVLTFIPGLGLIIYFFFGQDNRKRRVISRRTYRKIMKQPQQRKYRVDSSLVPNEYNPLVTLLENCGQSNLLNGTEIKIYTKGKEKFDDLCEALRSAKHHIHLQYYIFCDDEIGHRVRDILMEKAREGVEVRVLYDDVGCWNVKKKFYKEMKDAGVEILPFLKVVLPALTSKVNYRNHRKIVVIDGTIGFMGGMNIADRYEKGIEWGVWRDTHFRFVGRGVLGLQSVFLIDWFVASKQLLKGIEYFPMTEIHDKNNILQIATTGPIGQWRILLQAMIFAVANAKKYIYIQTPYFLPTEGLNQALQTAALGGVDVRLMLPERSDTVTANMATHSFIDEMVKAGVSVYFYKVGFLHSKLLVIDDNLACIGSANMDFRSFEHNFEVNAFVYEHSFALNLKEIFLKDMEDCQRIIPSIWLRRPKLRRIAESFMRLFSPLL